MVAPAISRERLHTPRPLVVRCLHRHGGVHLRSLRSLGRRAIRSEPSLFCTLVPLQLPRRRAVVADAALERAPAAVKLRAAEGATEVLTRRVARVRDKEDPAVPAPGKKPPHLGLVSQDGAQDDVVIQDELAHLATGVPVIIRGRLEALLDFYEKVPRVSFTMLMLLVTLSSYQPATNSSRGKTKAIFIGTGRGARCAVEMW